MKKVHLRCCPHPSLFRRTYMDASFLGMSGALHLNLFDQSVNFLESQKIRSAVTPAIAGVQASPRREPGTSYIFLDSGFRDCVAIIFLSFRASEARHGIQYFH